MTPGAALTFGVISLPLRGGSYTAPMRAVIQRVSSAEVRVAGARVATIETGLLVLLAVESGDGEEDLEFMCRKIAQLRIFEDGEGRMNRSVVEAGGTVLLVSQFTLYGDCRKGNRPSYSRAARPELAEAWYLRLADALRAAGIPVATGIFQAMMDVSLVNSGPVTLIVDSKKAYW